MNTNDNLTLRQRRIDAAYKAGLTCSRDKPYCPYHTEYEITAWRLGFDNQYPLETLQQQQEEANG